MRKPIEEILAPRPQARLRIYAYSIDDVAHEGLLKVGQTQISGSGVEIARFC